MLNMVPMKMGPRLLRQLSKRSVGCKRIHVRNLSWIHYSIYALDARSKEMRPMRRLTPGEKGGRLPFSGLSGSSHSDNAINGKNGFPTEERPQGGFKLMFKWQPYEPLVTCHCMRASAVLWARMTLHARVQSRRRKRSSGPAGNRHVSHLSTFLFAHLLWI